MLHSLLEVSSTSGYPSGPSTTTTSTGGDEDLSSRGDPASPCRATRLINTDTFNTPASWTPQWNNQQIPGIDPLNKFDDLFQLTESDIGSTLLDNTLSLSQTDSNGISVSAADPVQQQVVTAACIQQPSAEVLDVQPDLSSQTFVSPALIAHALNVLGASPSNESTEDTTTGVAEAAQLLAHLLECTDPVFASTQDDTPLSQWPATPTSADHSPRIPTQIISPQLSLPPYHFSPQRRESNFSTPRSSVNSHAAPPIDDDAPWPLSWAGSPRSNPWHKDNTYATHELQLGSPTCAKRVDVPIWNGHHTPNVLPEREGRSKVLTDFRNGSFQITNLYQIEKYLIEFSRDQMGARFIQQRLSCCPSQEAWFARSILTPRLKSLVTDVFGNHIVQRLIESGTPQQRHAIFLQLQGDILRFSLQTYGCRVLQKSLEVLSLEDKLAFAQELHNHVVRCVEDQNGNHVIQKCIERIPPAHMQFVIDAFQGQVARVSVHCYGCRVVQRVLEHCPFDQINGLLDEIMEDFIRLAQDQYGNYVVQHVLRYGRPSDKKVIVDRIAKDLQLLASHKFSSNVVEKCLEVCAAEESRRAIIRAAFGDNNDPRPPIMQMVRDRYANYVVQRMIDVTIQDGQEALIDEVIAKLEKHMPALKKFTYGKHIAAALERLRKQNEELRNREPSA